MKKIIECFVRSLPLSIIIIGAGYLIAYFLIRKPQGLDATLFVLGAIPIVIFLPSVLSQSKSGAIHTPKVIFRKVETLEEKKDKETENMFPALSYVLAGVLTWIFSFIVF